jgi:hypothetical protein
MGEHLVVPSIGCQQIAWAQRSTVRNGENALQPLDFESVCSVAIHLNHPTRTGNGFKQTRHWSSAIASGILATDGRGVAANSGHPVVPRAALLLP